MATGKCGCGQSDPRRNGSDDRASRETVTRVLSDFKRKQIIKLEGSTLVIRNRPELEELAS